ncbi:hypothetical protein FACS1894132_09410 [Clostridia bacterium]|nr:hypothetical protein FACS1894132_09410 [Clostridia bacterium]
MKNNLNIFTRYYSEKYPYEIFRYILIYKRYKIVFRLLEKTVEIYDVIDCRQDNNKNEV